MKTIYKDGRRIGQAGFDKAQIDVLTFVPLATQISNLMKGTFQINANRNDLEFDEDMGSKDDPSGGWNDPEPDCDPTNCYQDKTDQFDISVQAIEKLSETKKQLEKARSEGKGDMNVTKVVPEPPEGSGEPLKA